MTDLQNDQAALPSPGAPFTIRSERSSDIAAREALLDACFGGNRHERTCQLLRDGRFPAEGLALSAVRKGKLIGTVRLWHVSAGGIPALVLGPLAVDSCHRKLGVGAALMARALAAARARGHRAVILLGDAPYYARFGFSAAKARDLILPGAFERERLLGLELAEGALEGAWGMIVSPLAQALRRPNQAAEGEPRVWSPTPPDGLRSMASSARPKPRWTGSSFVRRIVTSMLMVMLADMIVRDLLARRWNAPRPPQSGVTERSR